MALIVAADHFSALLNEWGDYLSRCHLHLFVNDVEPEETLDVYDFEEPEDTSWYFPVPLDRWEPAYLNPDGRGEKDHPYVTFEWSGSLPVTVYGYFITDYYGYLVGSERDPAAPVHLTVPGQNYIVRPRITLANEVVPEPLTQDRGEL